MASITESKEERKNPLDESEDITIPEFLHKRRRAELKKVMKSVSESEIVIRTKLKQKQSKSTRGS